MSDTRKLAIGVTVNLGNNENLHIEVSDSVENAAEVSELRRYLASVLGDFGANDSSVRSLISGYIRRVLSDAESALSASDLPETGESCDTVFSFPDSSFQTKTVADSGNCNDDNLSSSGSQGLNLPPLPPAPVVEEKSEEFVCSKCGASVTKFQREVSMLFNHKILCDTCMHK